MKVFQIRLYFKESLDGGRTEKEREKIFLVPAKNINVACEWLLGEWCIWKTQQCATRIKSAIEVEGEFVCLEIPHRIIPTVS